MEATDRNSLFAYFQAFLLLGALPIQASYSTLWAFLWGAPSAVNSHVGFHGLFSACMAEVERNICERLHAGRPCCCGPGSRTVLFRLPSGLALPADERCNAMPGLN